jgi:dihydrofolate reductase
METKIRSMIVACTSASSQNPFGIGINNELPWHLPSELDHFVKITKKKSEQNLGGLIGVPLIIGRKNFDSFPKQKPLPGRKNIVLTRDKNWKSKNPNENIIVFDCPWKALGYAEEKECAGDELFIIGGEDIYVWYAKNIIVHRLYISFINAPNVKCDKFFPIALLNLQRDYTVKEETRHKPDENNAYGFTTRLYERKDFYLLLK